MVKCRIKDPNSGEVFEVAITADINNLDEESQKELLDKTADLAKLFARRLGYKLAEQGSYVADER